MTVSLEYLAKEAERVRRLQEERDELLTLVRRIAELDELSRTWAKRGGDPEDMMSEWRRRRELEQEIRDTAGPLVAKAEGRS